MKRKKGCSQIMVSRLTVGDSALQILSKADVRVPQGLLKLGEAVLVVLALEIALDGLQALFDPQQSRVQVGEHISGD